MARDRVERSTLLVLAVLALVLVLLGVVTAFALRTSGAAAERAVFAGEQTRELDQGRRAIEVAVELHEAFHTGDLPAAAEWRADLDRLLGALETTAGIAIEREQVAAVREAADAYVAAAGGTGEPAHEGEAEHGREEHGGEEHGREGEPGGEAHAEAAFARLLDELAENADLHAGESEAGLAAARRALPAEERRIAIVALLAGIIGVAACASLIRHARRVAREHREHEEFVEAMQAARSESEAYATLRTGLERTIDGARVIVLNRNNSADRLEADVPDGHPLKEPLQRSAADACLAVRTARPQERAPGERPLLTCDLCGRLEGATACVPSVVGSEVTGAVLAQHPRRWSASERARLASRVVEAAPAVANLKNLAIAELRAATDSLTGLPNARTIQQTLRRMVAHAGRTVTPLSAVIMDLDHFKAVNDTLGHDKGDEVLAAASAAASSATRESDFVGRQGGEEFVALLPGAGPQEAREVAERMRAAVAAIDVIERPVTASFGVATLPDDAGEPEQLLRLADRALYAAKRAGRNRVCHIGDGDPAADLEVRAPA